MLKAATQGELVFNATHTWVYVSLDTDELMAVKKWAEACGKSIPGLLRNMILEEIHYDSEVDIGDT